MTLAQSEAAKKRWQNPEYREKMTQIFKERWANPEYREKMSTKMKVVCSNPDYRQRMSESVKKKVAGSRVQGEEVQD